VLHEELFHGCLLGVMLDWHVQAITCSACNKLCSYLILHASVGQLHHHLLYCCTYSYSVCRRLLLLLLLQSADILVTGTLGV
jgi:hypothetical protein